MRTRRGRDGVRRVRHQGEAPIWLLCDGFNLPCVVKRGKSLRQITPKIKVVVKKWFMFVLAQ